MAKHNPLYPSIEQGFDVNWVVSSTTWDGTKWIAWRTPIEAETEQQAIDLFKAQNPKHTYRSITRA